MDICGFFFTKFSKGGRMEKRLIKPAGNSHGEKAEAAGQLPDR